MNWNKIKEQYPKAFKKFQDWCIRSKDAFNIEFSTDNDDLRDGFMFEWTVEKRGKFARQKTSLFMQEDIRTLYDFFDEQGIIIEIGLDSEFTDENGEVTIPECFYYQLYHNVRDATEDLSPAGYNAGYKTRTEAETAAFEKAFEILETKLGELK